MSRFVAGLLMAVGLLVAATTGLCSLGFGAVFLYEMATGAAPSQGMWFFFGFVFAGLIVAAIGWWVFRIGLARLRED